MAIKVTKHESNATDSRSSFLLKHRFIV